MILNFKWVSKVKSVPTMRAADRASPWWYGAGLLAIALVYSGVLPVRPAANANRWLAVLENGSLKNNEFDNVLG
jgi:hypothetical protein